MAVSISRKRLKSSRKLDARKSYFGFTILYNFFSRVSALVFLIILIYMWSSFSTIISGNIIHVCFSTRKLNSLYCLSAGTHPSFEIPTSTNNNSSITPGIEGNNVTEPSKVQGTPYMVTRRVDNNDRDKEVANAVKVVEEQLQIHRSWRSDKNYATCAGQGIYVYDLPFKFNKDLVGQCHDMVPWQDFCSYFSNEGLGEPITKLGKGWYRTHQYSLELIFHSRVLKHPCRVYDENDAKLFYVPFYGGLDILRWHFKNVSNDVKDSLALELVKWLERQGPWKRSSGKDHVFVLGKISWDFRRTSESPWGTRLLEYEKMQKPIKLLIERQPWHVNDIGIPHPTHFHPHSDNDIIAWQMKIIRSNRKNLVSFAGAARADAEDNIRSIIIDQCTSLGNGKCQFLNCSSVKCDEAESIIGLFVESEFCLQPPGDSPTRKSVFDSLISGCIPVLFDPFTAYYQYPWHLPQDHDKYSVFMDKREVIQMNVNVVERLSNISSRERENMRRYIIYELLPGLVYGDYNAEFDKFQDAFSITVNNLLERVSRLNEAYKD
ncbi:probable xyloglucan galactosyltransferase GT20 [Abrus precatorius]|uniref:Probable xyloglucan galactosyltransferase GT20 n=1 Tax=Abrus precatorius TaxID=3816 RepID=A0A8B8M4D7_ABRPR|nr:probable xyloglucan galactosyltransferase GT20 [Abrus precatorius]